MSAVFTNIVDSLASIEYNKITPAELEQFERYWLMYFIAGKRYGEAFCEHFHIGNATPLYHFKDESICRRWIKDNYIQQ